MYTAWLSRKPPTPYPLLPTPRPPQKINKMLEPKLHSDFHLVWHKAALPQLTAALKEYKYISNKLLSPDLDSLINILMNTFNLTEVLLSYDINCLTPYLMCKNTEHL